MNVRSKQIMSLLSNLENDVLPPDRMISQLPHHDNNDSPPKAILRDVHKNNDSVVQNIDLSKISEATQHHSINLPEAHQDSLISNLVDTATFDLLCNETLPSTSFCDSFIEDSDDSVKDKNYVPEPSSTSSSLRDLDITNDPAEIQVNNVNTQPAQLPVVKIRNKSCRKRKSELQYAKNIQKYPVREPCQNLCKKLCTIHFTEEDRKKINKYYWSLNWEHQGIFIKNLVTEEACKKSTKNLKRPRNVTYKYSLTKRDTEELSHEVCKVFFLGTLGYDKKNDRRVNSVLKKSILERKDNRDGRNLTNCHAIDRTLITAHIESFNPCVHHYRRVHAPNKRYLPSDLTIVDMYGNFQEKYPEFKCSLETYRDHLTNKMNISFAKLGHEQCETCETFNLHNLDHVKEPCTDCQICKTYAHHKIKYTLAREMYDADTKANSQRNTVIVSVDLQKVIMLPRIDTFKAALFCPRLVAYNETFVPLGNFKKGHVFAAVWHEGVAGRKQEDITSTFKAFLLNNRDAEHIVLWLDNCSAQNKNWCFFTFLISIINNLEISATTIELKFFEPGHTFMSADSFHHFVEQSMDKKGKLYDYQDFLEAVETSLKSGKVEVKSMEIIDFVNFKSHISHKKNKDIDGNRVYIKDIVHLMVKRGSHSFFYKKNFDDIEFKELYCLKSKNLPNFTVKTVPKGIDRERKRNILNVLGPLIPPNRLIFWKNLSVGSTSQEPEEFNFDIDE
ncbi:unnamed protein product [Chilo suppressalis]|uniref:DUF7869 domain-containing protein n=1 Tax=Chilo suppressalis TaxID=168631 RepID=A0ABN8APN6_CHISP|nr:unnamed protein product [Chilo suppressalis]